MASYPCATGGIIDGRSVVGRCGGFAIHVLEPFGGMTQGIYHRVAVTESDYRLLSGDRDLMLRTGVGGWLSGRGCASRP